MDNELAALYERIDFLTKSVEAQNQQLEILKSQNGYAAILEKLEYMTSQLAAQQRRQEEMDELKRDMIPIANHMIKLSIDELAEIGTEFQVEDLLFLLKRLLRDTHLLVELLDRMESTMGLFNEAQVIGNQAFHQAVITLDRLEREGYFAFARGGWRIIERIVTEFSDEDVEALGDNIVTILTTVKNLTQPEIMALTNNAISAIQSQPIDDGNVSVWALLRDLSDPQVRRGMARLLNIVRAMADQPSISEN